MENNHKYDFKTSSFPTFFKFWERLKEFWIVTISENLLKSIKDDEDYKRAVRNIKNSNNKKRTRVWLKDLV